MTKGGRLMVHGKTVKSIMLSLRRQWNEQGEQEKKIKAPKLSLQ